MPVSSQPKSHATRRALIDAAIELFGVDGYSAVSTRALSSRAETNVAAIKYHFGSKDTLYRSAIQHVVDELTPRLDMAFAAFSQARDLVGKDQVLQGRMIGNAIRALLNVFLGSEEMKRFLPFVLRELVVPSQHFDLFYDALPKRIHELICEVIALVQGDDPDAEETVIRAHALIGQMMAFNLGREILFRRLDWDTYDEARIDSVAREVTRTTLHALDLEVPDEDLDR